MAKIDEIVINGVSLAELKAMRSKVQQGANQFIAESLDEVKQKMKVLVGDEEKDVDEQDEIDVESLAGEIHDLLDSVKLVASVCDVEYYIPVYSDYTSDRSYYSQLEDNARGIDTFRAEGKLEDLMGLLEDMEYEVRAWNQSSC